MLLLFINHPVDADPASVLPAALPALIRWPIRLFCSLTGECSQALHQRSLCLPLAGRQKANLCMTDEITASVCAAGLSALWGWVSRIVGTLRGTSPASLTATKQRWKNKEKPESPHELINSDANFSVYVSGIQSLCKWLSRIWHFVEGEHLVCLLLAVCGFFEGRSEEVSQRHMTTIKASPRKWATLLINLHKDYKPGGLTICSLIRTHLKVQVAGCHHHRLVKRDFYVPLCLGASPTQVMRLKDDK